jgi:predicted nucleic acid-binding protein
VNETAVADTGPLLHLAEIGQESQLNIFGQVIISKHIEAELKRRAVFDRVAAILGNHLVIESVTQPELDAQRMALSRFKIHQADLSVAALAMLLMPDVVLTDDLALRKGLESQGCLVVGSVGIPVRAFRAGRLTKGELQTCFERLFDGSSLYLSKGFRTHVHNLLVRLIN